MQIPQILMKLLNSWKADGADSTSEQQAQWDPKRRLFVVGESPKLASTAPPTVEQLMWECHRVGCEEPTAFTDGLFCEKHLKEHEAQNAVAYSLKQCKVADCPRYTTTSDSDYCSSHTTALVVLSGRADWGQCHHYDMYNTGHRRCQALVPPGSTLCVDHTTIVTRIDNPHQCAWSDCKAFIAKEDSYCIRHSGQAKHVYGFVDGKVISDPEVAEFEKIFEDVDWKHGVDIFNECAPKYRRYRKTGFRAVMNETIHFSVETRGSRDDVDIFHGILKACDSDYPLDPFRKRADTLMRCDKCDGYSWRTCTLTPHDIKAAASQAGIKVKIRHYKLERKCGGKLVAVAAGA